MRLCRVLSVGAVAALAVHASADIVIFSDDFNAENHSVGVLNYTGFAQWTVSDGSVDLIGNGFHDFYPGNGLYVDLDGSTNNAGTITTANLGLVAGATYEISFDLGGSQRGGSDTATLMVSIGNFNESFTLNSNDPLTTITRTFVANGDGAISFEGIGGDNVGLILDNVQMSLIPLPNGALLGLAGLTLAGIVTHRRTRRLARE